MHAHSRYIPKRVLYKHVAFAEPMCSAAHKNVNRAKPNQGKALTLLRIQPSHQRDPAEHAHARPHGTHRHQPNDKTTLLDSTAAG